MTTITQSIPSLGSPPLTSDPVNFDTRADTLYGTSLPAVITATNTWSGQANTVAGEVNTNATNAATQASNAAGSASAASTSASNAATSASNASTSASNAASSASAASTSASNAAATYDLFDDRYLGAKASDPSLDNDGNALVTGAMFFNTTSNTTRIYNGTGWQDSAAVATSINLANQVTGTLPVANGGTGITSFGAGIATFLGTPSSENLAAAVTNETGSGALVFANTPTLITPILGTPQSGTLTNVTGLPIVAGTTGTLSVARGGTGLTTLTANNVILGNGTSTPSFVAPSTSGNVLTSNGTTWTSAAAPSSGFTLGTSVATTSGTSITFTGIPSGVKQIVISFKQVSTNGTSYKWIRLGTSAGLQINTGYENNALRLKAATAIEGINASGGFAIYSQGATNWMSGSVVLTLENSSSNTWAAFGLLGDNYNSHTFTVAGAVSLSGVLDRVSFSAENGTDTFDEGEMNIAYI